MAQGTSDWHDAGGLIFDALQGFLSLYGLGPWFDKIAGKTPENQAEVEKLVMQLINKVKTLGASALEKLDNKLMALPIPVSTTIRDAIQTARNTLNKEREKVNLRNEIAETKADEATLHLNHYLNASAGDYVSGAASKYKDKAIAAAREANKIIGENSYEQKV